MNPSFSTTRHLTKVQPTPVHSPESKFKTLLDLPGHKDRIDKGGFRTRGYFKRNMKDKPLVSVITVVYNGEEYLEETIQSVITQSYDHVEYIIVDGSSTDGSLDIIKQYDDRIDYWVSEPDKGIYHAMNKGITLAQGEVIAILNSDDTFEPHTLEKVVETATGIREKEFVIHGKIALYDTNRTCVGERAPKKIPAYHLFSTPFKHPAMFVSRQLYQKVGLYDENCGLAADYDMMLRIKKQRSVDVFIDHVLTQVKLVGISTGRNVNASWKELRHILKRHTGNRFLTDVVLAFRTFNKWLKNLSKK